MKYLLFCLTLLVCLYLLLWIVSVKSYPIEYGISFNQNHAESLGLDWRATYLAMLDELTPKYIRIAAMWSEVEKEQGVYTYGDVDWMMGQAAKRRAKVILVVGQKAPRWPECHVPAWIDHYEHTAAARHLFDYLTKTVERYRDHEALEFWQVENEPFITFRFGECDAYREELVSDEIARVQSLDSHHRIIITDSGELSTWRKANQAGDYFGTTLYRIVQTPKGRTWTYDWLPAAYYRFKALLWGRDLNTFFVSELQAEPWFTNGSPIDTPTEEQEKTMNPIRLEKHLDYVTHIGTSRAYLWGVEWWYWMKQEKNDSRYWDLIKERIAQTNEKEIAVDI